MASAKRCRILLVEDDLMVAMLLEDMLSDLGHEVVATVSKIETASEFIENGSFDAAVLDLDLNGVDTYSLAEALKRQNIPFIFATGYAETDLKREWKQTPVLPKPFQKSDLERILHRALSG